MDLKETAKRLLKLADQIEKEASENSYFVCDHCNHTASLAEINDRRVKLASTEDPEMEVQRVTVNDRVKCAACEGIMAYVPSDDSERYYVTAEDEVEEEAPAGEMPPVEEEDQQESRQSESPAEGDEDAPDDADIDIDKLFEDVETQAQKAKGEGQESPEESVDDQGIPENDTSSALPPEEPRQEEAPAMPEKPEEEPTGEQPPVEEAPAEEAPEEETPAAEEEVEEEVVEEKPAEKPKKKKKDKPDDGKANWEKEEVPQFKSKEAIERFASSLERYSL